MKKLTLNTEQAITVLNEKIAAEMLGISVSTLRRWRLLGRGPLYRKLNGCVRYLVSDIEQFITDNARVSTGRQA